MTTFNKLSQKIITSANANKPMYKFKVNFLRMPDNFGDFLGKRVKTVTYPSIGADFMTHSYKRTTFPDKGKILRGGELMIGFIPDSDALTEMLVYSQLHRQYNVISDAWGSEANTTVNNYKFDIKVTHYSTEDKETKYDIFKNCFINLITMPEMDTAMDDQMVPLMTVSFAFDAIESSIVDTFVELRF